MNKIIAILPFLFLCNLCCAKIYVLNNNAEKLKITASSEEIVNSVEFFVQNIVKIYSSKDGLYYERLESSSFYKNNIRFLRRALLHLQPQDIHPLEVKKAFFLNLYNILTLDFILNLKTFPTSLDKFPNYDEKVAYEVGGKTLTLAAIKHGILRANQPNPSGGKKYLTAEEEKSWTVESDPRVLFGLFPVGTENFPSFNKENIDDSLTDLTIEACTKGIELVDDSGVLINKIFKDLQPDFANDEEGLLRWLSRCTNDRDVRHRLYFSSSMMDVTFVEMSTAIKKMKNVIEDDRLSIKIYMEALCQDVHDFFIHQLEPTWKSSSPIMNVTIIPFGKASVQPINNGEKFSFECQHGPSECEVNKVMSCIVAYFPTHIQIPLLSCMMASPQVVGSETQCALKLKVPMAAVSQCKLTLEGSQVLYDNGEETTKLQPKLFFVPTITINENYNSSTLQQSVKHFSDFVCQSYMDQPKGNIDIFTPEGCKVQLQVIIDATTMETRRFFVDQVVPSWRRISNSMELKIVPYESSIINKDASDQQSEGCLSEDLACQVNMIVSCMVKLFQPKTEVNFLFCLFRGKITERKIKECAQEEGINWSAVESCMKGPMGLHLAIENGIQVKELFGRDQHTLPMIVVNNVVNDTLNNWATHDLTALVCDSFIPLESKTVDIKSFALPLGCPVKVEIYMEMLCPDTNRFIRNVLYPSWKTLKPIIDLHIVPFGKANVWISRDDSSTYDFECQHGPAECEGNKLMSCIVEYLPIDAQVEFLHCMMLTKSEIPEAKSCAISLGILWEPLELCSTSNEGSKLLYHNGVRTMGLIPELFYVPTITLNGHYNVEQLKTSLNSLQDQICDIYQNVEGYSGKRSTPKGCKLKIEVFLSTNSLTSKNFFMNQLLPTWKNLGKEVLHVTFIPTEDSSTKFENNNCLKDDKCRSNVIFTCVTQHSKIDNQVEFLKCIFESNSSLAAQKKCATDLLIPWSQVSKCYTGEEGLKLLLRNNKLASSLRPSFHTVPTVTINGFYDKNELKKSTTDLLGLVCSSFQDLSSSSLKPWSPKGCPVSVEVFLESRCEAAIKFFLTQLEPTYHQLKKIINLKIITFGKAIGKIVNVDKEEYEFTCQNGPSECEGNKLLSCVTHLLPVDDQIAIIKCLFEKSVTPKQGKQCAEELGYDWPSISNCLQKDSSKLLYQNGLSTAQVKPKIFYIPTVTINKFYSKNSLRHNLKDFKGVVCESFLQDFQTSDIDEVPHECKVTLQIFFANLDDRMKMFFSSEAEEIWRMFKRIIILKFIPLIPDMHEKHLNSSQICATSVDNCLEPKILSCLVATYKVEVQMHFLACLMSNVDYNTRIKDCSESLGLNMDVLDFCASSKGAELLQINYETYETFIKPGKNNFLPLAIVDKDPVSEHRHLQRMICSKFKGPKPYECDIYRHPLN